MRRPAKTAGIAHTIVKDPLILIFDKDTSAVDNETGALTGDKEATKQTE